jgi:hypothetical protein
MPVYVVPVTGTAPMRGDSGTLGKNRKGIRDRLDSSAGRFRASVTQLATRERGSANARYRKN